jgi:hypothetical protein
MIETIKEIINDIPDDKKDHVLFGMIIGYPLILLGLILDAAFGIHFFFLAGGFLGLAIVGGKEIILDYWQGKGNPEWWDFIASAIPIIAVMFGYII